MAVGVAEALDYLHNGCGEPVIHKDVKSSNILLSDDFEPQVLYVQPCCIIMLGLNWVKLPICIYHVFWFFSCQILDLLARFQLLQPI